jgi:hypothetical protein
VWHEKCDAEHSRWGESVDDSYAKCYTGGSSREECTSNERSDESTDLAL